MSKHPAADCGTEQDSDNYMPKSKDEANSTNLESVIYQNSERMAVTFNIYSDHIILVGHIYRSHSRNCYWKGKATPLMFYLNVYTGLLVGLELYIWADCTDAGGKEAQWGKI